MLASLPAVTLSFKNSTSLYSKSLKFHYAHLRCRNRSVAHACMGIFAILFSVKSIAGNRAGRAIDRV